MGWRAGMNSSDRCDFQAGATRVSRDQALSAWLAANPIPLADLTVLPRTGYLALIASPAGVTVMSSTSSVRG